MIDIKGFWANVLAQNADAIREYFDPGAYVNWHNTNEHFTVEDFIRANCEYPGEWMGEVERIVSADDTVITAAHVQSKNGDLSFHVASFFKVKDGKIISLDEYWGDDGDAPRWRLDMGMGSKIKE